MIRPCYRSRLFWLGIPGLVFLLWSWFAYPRRGMDLIWAGTDRWMCLRDNGRHIFIAYQALPPPGKPGFVIRQDTCGPEQVDPLLPPAIKWRTGLQGFNLVVAYWTLLLIYLPAWLAALASSQRRKARLSRRSAAEMPGS